jgi:DNA-directed RNA polymerase specialized sigma24 family protein
MTKGDHGGVSSAGPATDVAAAAAGDHRAWERLVDRHAQGVWSIARGLGLGADAAAEVCEVVWTRLVDHLEELRTDQQLGWWLGATAEREARRAVRAGLAASRCPSVVGRGRVSTQHANNSLRGPSRPPI